MRRVAIAALLLLFATVARTQQTWIVDNGQNGTFATIQAAVAAASDGDLILLRHAGTLSLDFALSKGVRIVGDNGAPRSSVTGQLTISGLTASQQVVLRSLAAATSPNTSYAKILVENCVGQVVLDDVVLETENQTWPYQQFGTALEARNSAHVSLHRVNLHGMPAMVADHATITCTTATITGRSVTPNSIAPLTWLAVFARNSRLQFASCTLTGGGDYFRLNSVPSSALRLYGSLATLAGGSVNGGGFVILAPSVDLNAASWLEHDSATVFNAAMSGATGNVSLAETGRITGGLGAVGQPATFDFAAIAGNSGFLALSLPGPEVATPFGPAWLFSATTDLVAMGQLPLQAVIAAPFNAPRGVALALQGAVLHQGAVRLSTPLVTALR